MKKFIFSMIFLIVGILIGISISNHGFQKRIKAITDIADKIARHTHQYYDEKVDSMNPDRRWWTVDERPIPSNPHMDSINAYVGELRGKLK